MHLSAAPKSPRERHLRDWRRGRRVGQFHATCFSDQGVFPMKSRVFLPAMLAVGFVYAVLASNASAFELLNRVLGHGHGSCCAPVCAPKCGCEPTCCPAPVCEPTCCPAPVCEPKCCPAPVCEPKCCPAPVCEPTCCPAPCCEKKCGRARVGLLQRLFSHCKRSCAPKCVSVCEPVCGCEPTCCPAPCAPACGCGH